MSQRNASEYDLRQHYLFAALDEPQRARLLPHTRVLGFVSGELLFSQDDPASTFFLLQSGAVKLFRVSAEGHEKIMRIVRPGQSFAESVMFMRKPHYPVHGAGIEAGTLIVVECAAFYDILRKSFDTCCAVMEQMAQRIQGHWDEIEALTLQNSRYRVVHYLLGLVPRDEHGPFTVILPVRKMMIAAQLAITPETFSRTLRGLVDQGFISVHDETIRIRDVDGLLQSLR